MTLVSLNFYNSEIKIEWCPNKKNNMLTDNYRMKRMAKLATGNNILDIGCSDYPNAFLDGSNIIGFDIKEAKLTNNYKQFVQGDVMQLANFFEEGTFDSVVAGEIIEHLENPIDFLKQCYRILKTKGNMIISTPNLYFPLELILNYLNNTKFMYTPDHLFIFPPRWLKRLMQYVGFSNKKMYSGGFAIPNIVILPSPKAICHHMIYLAQKIC